MTTKVAGSYDAVSFYQFTYLNIQPFTVNAVMQEIQYMPTVL